MILVEDIFNIGSIGSICDTENIKLFAEQYGKDEYLN